MYQHVWKMLLFVLASLGGLAWIILSFPVPDMRRFPRRIPDRFTSLALLRVWVASTSCDWLRGSWFDASFASPPGDAKDPGKRTDHNNKNPLEELLEGLDYTSLQKRRKHHMARGRRKWTNDLVADRPTKAPAGGILLHHAALAAVARAPERPTGGRVAVVLAVPLLLNAQEGHVHPTAVGSRTLVLLANLTAHRQLNCRGCLRSLILTVTLLTATAEVHPTKSTLESIGSHKPMTNEHALP